MSGLLRVFSLAAAGACAVVASGAHAQNANASDLAIGAVVDTRCTVSTNDLNFGNVDIQNVTQVDANATVTVQCSGLLTIFRLEMDWGSNANVQQRRLKNGTGDYLRYEIYRNNRRTQRWGLAPTESRNGIILFSNASIDLEAYGRLSGITPATPPGIYSDTVTVTLNF